MLQLTNTLTKKKEQFTSITPGNVGMYNCGPTVYDYAHIGNLRSYVFANILRRALELNNYKVTQVINITDIGHLASDADDGEDKMTKGLKREGKPLTLEAMKEMADFYTEKFKEDLQALNISLPEVMPKASEHIEEDIELLQKLEQKGFVYKTSDGLYFDTAKDPNYGKLGGISEIKIDEEQSRIGVNSEKHSPRDFAVWKFNSELGYESPWGKGFPGWHIECSVMSMKYLGETFDIHTGGIDHIPVHHNNEIAQSESATGKPYVNFWLHNAFVTMYTGKMSKSEGNVFRLIDLPSKGISPLAYKFWLLTARYNTEVHFSEKALAGAQQAYNRLIQFVRENFKNSSDKIQPNAKYYETFVSYINDDLDTPKALTIVWEVIGDQTLSGEEKVSTLFAFDNVLGLGLKDIKPLEIPDEVSKLLKARELARNNKDWTESDRLRDEIKKHGFEVKDTGTGQTLS